MSSSGILSLLGWSFLPNLVTGWLQSFYYSLTIRAGDPKPQPGTPRWAEHRRRIHILVVTVYLLYTIYEADYDLQNAGSFYTDLGLPITATSKEAKTRFRRLAALYHPDKVYGSENAEGANAFFVHLKTAHDALVEPAKRFAYDRFGPDILKWRHCVTIRDYVMHGAQSLVMYYFVAAMGMYGAGLLGYLEWGRFERWLVLGILFLFEAYTVTRPYAPPVLTNMVSPLITRFGNGRAPYLQFQAIALAKKLAVTIYLAFSQIGPLLSADTSGGQIVIGKKGANEEAALKQNLERLEQLTKRLDADTTNVLQLELAPFAGDRDAMEITWGKVKEWLVHNTIRSDVMVRDAMGRMFARRRADAPAGARGTR
ncbi:chaperone protein DnaJ [Podospora australis]|uniref:Chaperone protein DnaJ n=1 Tax=Podospora australis TaxID=1536484 RepID=A0AAN6X1L9_9PEZI|nr:chaperone protein DnaJ [Podospora australis]